MNQIISRLKERNETISTAESITAGGIANKLTSIPGASAVFVGGVVAYQNLIKINELKVSADLIAQKTPVSKEVVEAMASGAKEKFGTTWAIATTGVAGPDSLAGHQPGEVWIAIAGPVSQSLQLNLTGGREEIRAKTISMALETLTNILDSRK